MENNTVSTKSEDIFKKLFCERVEKSSCDYLANMLETKEKMTRELKQFDENIFQLLTQIVNIIVMIENKNSAEILQKRPYENCSHIVVDYTIKFNKHDNSKFLVTAYAMSDRLSTPMCVNGALVSQAPQKFDKQSLETDERFKKFEISSDFIKNAYDPEFISKVSSENRKHLEEIRNARFPQNYVEPQEEQNAQAAQPEIADKDALIKKGADMITVLSNLINTVNETIEGLARLKDKTVDQKANLSSKESK